MNAAKTDYHKCVWYKEPGYCTRPDFYCRVHRVDNCFVALAEEYGIEDMDECSQFINKEEQ